MTPDRSKQQYDVYAWIKVKRYERDRAKSLEQQYDELERHHIEETTFLINKVRELAAEIDALRHQSSNRGISANEGTASK